MDLGRIFLHRAGGHQIADDWWKTKRKEDKHNQGPHQKQEGQAYTQPFLSQSFHKVPSPFFENDSRRWAMRSMKLGYLVIFPR